MSCFTSDIRASISDLGEVVRKSILKNYGACAIIISANTTLQIADFMNADGASQNLSKGTKTDQSRHTKVACSTLLPPANEEKKIKNLHESVEEREVREEAISKPGRGC